jgi:hypothetical protein
MGQVRLFLDEVEARRLPRVCIRCGARAVDLVARKFSWAPLFTRYGLLGMITTWRVTVALPVCPSHAGFIWRGLGGMRATHIDRNSITLTGVAEEFIDAMWDLREADEAAAPPLRVLSAQPLPTGPPRPRRGELPPPSSSMPVWGWLLLGTGLLVLGAVVVGLTVGLGVPRAPRPVFPLPQWPAGGAKGPAQPAEVPREQLAALAVGPHAGFPAAVPWLFLARGGGNSPLRLLTAAELDKALADLRSQNPFAARDAGQLLGKAFPEGRRGEVAAALEAALTSPAPMTREAVPQALAVWGSAASVPALVRLLDDPFPGPRAAAMDALATFKDERAAEPVARRLTSFPDRAHASKTLQAMGPVAEKAVVALLGNRDRNVRIEACRVLGIIGSADSLPALQNLALDQDRGVAQAAEAAAQAVRNRR